MSVHVVAGLRALRLVAERPDPTAPLGVGAIAEALGRTVSGASRLCAELERIGLLERGAAYGSYRLGPRALRLSGRAAAPFETAVGLALAQVAARTGETVCLNARTGDTSTVVAVVESTWTLHVPAAIGQRVAPDSAVHEASRAQGRAARSRPHESRVGLVVELAVPVRDPAGRCVAVLSVRLPVNRLRSVGPRCGTALHAARDDLERHLAGVRASAFDTPDAPRASDVPGLEAAARILEHVALHPSGIARIATATGLHPDRARRLVVAGVAAGLLVVDDGVVEASWGLHGWHRAATVPTLQQRGTPLVEATAQRTGASSFVTVLRAMRSVTLIERLRDPAPGLVMTPWLGRPCPIIAADGGPALVCDWPTEAIGPMIPGAPTVDAVADFVARVEHVVRDGVLAKESFEAAGQIAVSAPVRDASGAVVASACIVGAADAVRARVAELEVAAVELAAGLTALLAPEIVSTPR